MSEQAKDGGLAFPRPAVLDSLGGVFDSAEDGMTLRDYFAAKAMQGFCAHPSAGIEWSSLEIARAAYAQADAMIIAQGAA